MGRKHTHYNTEFRAEAVRRAETFGPSIRQAALDLGTSNEHPRPWIAPARERSAERRSRPTSEPSSPSCADG